MTGVRRITGRHVLFALLGFFGVVFAANAIFIVLALRSFPGESEKKSYVQGLHYNDMLVERAKQAALGWRAEITRVERSESGGVIELRIVDADGRALSSLNVEGILKRPTHAGEDIGLAFEELGKGVYLTQADAFPLGAWDLEAHAENSAGDHFDIAARIFVK